MADGPSEPGKHVAGPGSKPGWRDELHLQVVAAAVALAGVGVLIAVFGSVPTRGGGGGRSHIPGSGFVLLLGVAIVGLVCLVRAWRDGRARRAKDDGSDGAPGGAPGGGVPGRGPR
jgi:hypothetical protein